MNLKRILPAALIFALHPLNAATFGKFTYTDEGASITITDYPTTETGVVSVPASIVGKPVTAIGPNAFGQCQGITNITFPASLKTIGNAAFFGCSSLNRPLFPAGLTYIGDYAFGNCNKFVSITIPEQVTSMGEAPFYSCLTLTSIAVNASNPSFSSNGGVLFNKTRTTLLAYPAGKVGSYTVPSTVKVIDVGAFGQCYQLANVLLPSGLTDIKAGAFTNCTSLVNANFPNTLISIGDSAFRGCTALTNVLLPTGLTSIGYLAFLDCHGLTTINVPASVSNNLYAPFPNCRNLKSITVDAASLSYSSVAGVLFNKSRTRLIQFPGGSTVAFYAIPSTTTTILSAAFESVKNLNSLYIPSSVTLIENRAINYCNFLTEVTFLGNAPNVQNGLLFEGSASGFKIQFINGKTGYTTPTWLGHPSFAIAAAPEIDIKDTSLTSLVDGSSVIPFGTRAVNMQSANKIYRIINTGSAALTGISVSIAGANPDSYLFTAPAVSSLQPGTSTTFSVSFRPKSVGSNTAILRVSSNDADENPFDITLTGNGTP